jgi:hypothetical protein
MERTVIWWRRVSALPRAVPRANGREREPEPGRLESVPMPVELRLQKLGGGGRLDRYRGGSGRRHAGWRTHNETGVTGEDQQEPESDTSGECPEVTSTPAHQHELSRISNHGIPLASCGETMQNIQEAEVFLLP